MRNTRPIFTTLIALSLTIGGAARAAASGGPVDPMTGQTVVTAPYVSSLSRDFDAPAGTIAALHPAGNSPQLSSGESAYSSAPAPDGTMAALHEPSRFEVEGQAGISQQAPVQ
jgi:hypothetical protein